MTNGSPNGRESSPHDESVSAGENPAPSSVWASFLELLGWCSAGGFVGIATLITLDVLLRAVNLGGLPWATDMSEYLLFMATFLGAPWVLRHGAHVRVDLFLAALPARIGRWLEQGVNLAGIVICGILAWFGAVATFESWQLGTMLYKLVVTAEWPFRAIFTVSMLLLIVEFLLRMRRVAVPLGRGGRAVGG